MNPVPYVQDYVTLVRSEHYSTKDSERLSTSTLKLWNTGTFKLKNYDSNNNRTGYK